jgi:RNA recognition motif-containing protein
MEARNIDVALSGNFVGSRPKSPHVSRLRPAPSPVPRAQDNVIIKGGTHMGSKIYVGGLPYSATEQQLSDLFGAHGAVASARIITDKFTGQSRGFGFVEMSSDSEAQAAITALNGSDMGGRTLTVNEARPQEPRGGGGGGRGGFGGGGGRGAGGKRDRW